MGRIVSNLALAASLVALVVGLWHDWSLLSTVKRMVVGYLGFYFLGSIMVLVVKFVGVLEKDQPDGAEEADRQTS